MLFIDQILLGKTKTLRHFVELESKYYPILLQMYGNKISAIRYWGVEKFMRFSIGNRNGRIDKVDHAVPGFKIFE